MAYNVANQGLTVFVLSPFAVEDHARWPRHEDGVSEAVLRRVLLKRCASMQDLHRFFAYFHLFNDASPAFVIVLGIDQYVQWVFDAWRAAPRASDASAAARALHSLENTITLAVDAMGVSNPRTQELQGSSLPPPWHLASSPQCNNSVSPADSSAQPDLPTSERLASVTAAPDTAPAPPSQSTFSSESALVSHAATSALEVPAELEAYGSPTGASPALPSAEPTAAPSRKPHITGSLVLQLCRPLYSHIHHADGGNDAAVGPDEGGEGCVPAADLRRVLEQYLPLHLSMERVAEGGARLMEEEHPRMTLCQYVPLAWRSAPGDPVYDVGGGGGINALAAGWDVFGRPSGSHARAVHPAGWTAALGRQLHMQRSEVCL